MEVLKTIWKFVANVSVAIPVVLLFYYSVWPLPIDEFRLPLIIGGAAGIYVWLVIMVGFGEQEKQYLALHFRNAAIALGAYTVAMMLLLSADIMRRTEPTNRFHTLLAERSTFFYELNYAILFFLFFFGIVSVLLYIPALFAWIKQKMIERPAEQDNEAQE